MNKSSVLDLIIKDKSGKYGLALPAEDYDTNKIRYLRISDIDDNGILLNTDKKSISSKDIDSYILEKDNLVVARTGNSTGRTYMYSEDDEKMAYAGFLMKYVFDNKKINPRYLKYYTVSDVYRKQIAKYSGSTRGNMNAQDFLGITVYYPNRSTQNKLVSLFDDIERLIKTNNKIIQNLESLAKTIYDYWFLQFEFPNEEGKPYKSSGGKMVWCEELKREIPEGWELTTLGEMFHITMGSSPKGDSLNEVKCGIEFYQGSTDFGNIYPNERVYTTSPIRKATSQDVLLSVRAPVGDMNIAMNDCCIGRGLAAIHSESTLLTWNTLKSLHSYFDVYNNNGTTFGALTADSLKGLITLNIPPRLIQEYEKQVSGFEKIIRNKELESRSLSSLRDFLLPMLMNGQVTFKDN